MNTINALDCSAEVSGMPTEFNSGKAWLREDIHTGDWLFTLNDSALQEIDQLAASLSAQTQATAYTDYHLPECEALFANIKNVLDNGVGFAVASNLPVDQYEADVLVQIFCVLGSLIGRPVAQKHNGEMIYSVKDTGRQFQYGVRGSRTNVELNFHTDNAFGKAPPEYVGLLCKHPAKSGGISRFCSLYALHQTMHERNPQALQRLYKPMYFDRQKEHAEGEAPVTYAPFFTWKNNQLQARANTSLVRKGYEVAAITPDQELSTALDCLDQISSEPQFWYEAELQQGQIQYLNNSEVGHYRSEFTDHTEEHKKRHLYRLWHRDTGSVNYHGVDS